MNECERYIELAKLKKKKYNSKRFYKIAREARAYIIALVERYRNEPDKYPLYIREIYDGMFYFARVDGENIYVNFMDEEELTLLGYGSSYTTIPNKEGET